MRKLFQRESEKAGLVPGALVHVGEASTAPVRITVMDYGAERVEERELTSVEEGVRPALRSPRAAPRRHHAYGTASQGGGFR
jgi:hypothetical protein